MYEQPNPVVTIILSSGEIFKNGYILMWESLVDTPCITNFQCLGGRGHVGVNQRLQKNTQEKVCRCKIASTWRPILVTRTTKDTTRKILVQDC